MFSRSPQIQCLAIGARCRIACGLTVQCSLRSPVCTHLTQLPNMVEEARVAKAKAARP